LRALSNILTMFYHADVEKLFNLSGLKRFRAYADKIMTGGTAGGFNDMASKWMDAFRSKLSQLFLPSRNTDQDHFTIKNAMDPTGGKQENEYKKLARVISLTLSKQERRLFELRIKGCTDETICRLMNLTPQTLDLLGRNLIDKFRSIRDRRDLEINEQFKR